ncbi:CBS domain-containing protein [Desulfovirgula thermocuniculi]|uniref:CBS domain-containing protein n=1 Tax=Desulfovirgula thermocuniculi TaxID=348842 RepID=UPI000400C904|nr:CBS domain-containing protein [Desulfovirgula thermocuniculi]
MNLRTAKDIMVPIHAYATVKENDTLKTALLHLHRALYTGSAGHRTLAVLDEYGNLTGFLTVRSILKSLEALAYKESLQGGRHLPSVSFWARLFLKNKIEKIAGAKVRDVMRPVEKIFVHEDTSLTEVARVILLNRVNHIPVLDKEHRVVGIVRSIDLLDVIDEFLGS